MMNRMERTEVEEIRGNREKIKEKDKKILIKGVQGLEERRVSTEFVDLERLGVGLEAKHRQGEDLGELCDALRLVRRRLLLSK